MNDYTIFIKDIQLSFPRHRVGLKSVFRWFKRRFGENVDIPPFVALNNVSAQAKRGEVLGIIGKNGSGKSTLLRVMSGIYQPDKGEGYGFWPS